MSLRAMLWAFDKTIFPASNKFVLVALANFCGDDGKSYPGIASLCKLTSLQEDTIRKALTKLCDDGIIYDTGLTTGSTGRIKVFQLPDEVCEIPIKTGVLKYRRTPVQTPPNPSAIPDSMPTPNMGTITGTVTSARFTKPTMEEAKAKAVEIGMPTMEGEKFFYHFESKGWVVGRSPMKSWPAALQTWKRNWISYNPTVAQPVAQSDPEVMRAGGLTFTRTQPPRREQFESEEKFQTYMTAWRKKFGTQGI